MSGQHEPTASEMEAFFAANPDTNTFTFTRDDEPMKVTSPQTRRSFTRNVAKVGFAAAVAGIFMKAKGADAEYCFYEDYGGGRQCLYDSCSLHRAYYIEQRMKCCSAICYWTNSYSYRRAWCGCG